MRKQIEGSQAIAQAVATCRPGVICAYPISPQTHIVEALDDIVRKGGIENCVFLNVESEFGAMSVAIGSSATGSRTYTATASQGLLYMVEAVYNASGLGLPIVMTVANRAIGAPINIWNDHTDAMSQRDSGWIQLYAQDNQAAADLHVFAFRLAELVSMPVMVCMDGFVLTHAMEQIDVPEQAQSDAFLTPFVPRQKLDVENPVSIGAMVGPEAFTEVRWLAHHKQLEALAAIPGLAEEFARAFGRRAGGPNDFMGLVTDYGTEGAETVVVALGATIGTLEDVIDEMREQGTSIGVLGITSYRPFPTATIREKLKHAKRVVVLERAFAVGIGGVVDSDIRMALNGLDIPQNTVVAGLGGRAITRHSLHDILAKSIAGDVEPLTFLDLNEGMIPA
ncbi:MAG: transketolase C-terminal domain-containing protein [Candidatus Nanopelagicales bacterium]